MRVLKLGAGALMVAGIWLPVLALIAGLVLAVLMAGAIAMHIKVGDPVKRYLPALSVFSLSTISAILNGNPPADRAATD